eukprot:g2866.t1
MGPGMPRSLSTAGMVLVEDQENSLAGADCLDFCGGVWMSHAPSPQAAAAKATSQKDTKDGNDGKQDQTSAKATSQKDGKDGNDGKDGKRATESGSTGDSAVVSDSCCAALSCTGNGKSAFFSFATGYTYNVNNWQGGNDMPVDGTAMASLATGQTKRTRTALVAKCCASDSCTWTSPTRASRSPAATSPSQCPKPPVTVEKTVIPQNQPTGGMVCPDRCTLDCDISNSLQLCTCKCPQDPTCASQRVLCTGDKVRIVDDLSKLKCTDCRDNGDECYKPGETTCKSCETCVDNGNECCKPRVLLLTDPTCADVRCDGNKVPVFQEISKLSKLKCTECRDNGDECCKPRETTCKSVKCDGNNDPRVDDMSKLQCEKCVDNGNECCKPRGQ